MHLFAIVMLLSLRWTAAVEECNSDRSQLVTDQLVHHLAKVLEDLTLLTNDMNSGPLGGWHLVEDLRNTMVSMNSSLHERIQYLETTLHEEIVSVYENMTLLRNMPAIPPTNSASTNSDENMNGHTQYGAARCGSILIEHPRTKNLDEGNILCVLSKENPAHSAFVSTPCKDLIWGLPGFVNVNDLLAAGGKFGCRRGNSGLEDPSLALCHIGQGQDYELAYRGCHPACDTLAVCIQYPGADVSTLPSVTTVSSVSKCGSEMVEVALPDDERLSGWTACQINKRENASLATMACRDVARTLGITSSADFGCYRSRSTSDLSVTSWRRTCRARYQHALTLASCTHCDVMLLCYKRQ